MSNFILEVGTNHYTEARYCDESQPSLIHVYSFNYFAIYDNGKFILTSYILLDSSWDQGNIFIMSDYIYGSSLRAAKSKANYLFEGDFRRRPNQNLGGASRSMARVELLQQAAEQRQSREDTRKREQSSLIIQSLWRGYSCRKKMSQKMRDTFDTTVDKLSSPVSTRRSLPAFEASIDKLVKEFIVYYHSGQDETRFNSLIDIMQSRNDIILRLKFNKPKVWLHRIKCLLSINLKYIQKHGLSTDVVNFSFLERYTRPNEMLDAKESIEVWNSMVMQKFYTIMRSLIDLSDNSRIEDNQLNHRILELVERSLDLEPESNITYSKVYSSTVYSFYKEFLRGPLSDKMHSNYLPNLIDRKPKRLDPGYIIAEFHRLPPSESTHLYEDSRTNNISIEHEFVDRGCYESIWLCYSFVRTVYNRLDGLSDLEKASYVGILSKLIGSAEYVTNISLMQAANNEEEQLDSDTTTDGLNSSLVLAFQSTQNLKEIHIVISKLIDLINHMTHINGLKSIIFNADLQSHIQSSIVKICNLMLAHEHLAIFNCRLLYTVAFSREFSRSLWKSIITSTGASLFGASIPIHLQISTGETISADAWKIILPKLRLFCSLCSYLIPTLDDAEFYTEKDDSMFIDDKDRTGNHNEQSSGSFFVDKELVGISATLRDICVGFIEALYQVNRNSVQQSNLILELNNQHHAQPMQDEKTRLLSFEKKVCFKALVRLVCQLHAKDSRKQYCPEGHWICPSVVIPANKAIDFQLVTSQQGRLLNHMTKDDANQERTSSTPSEIKTVLILQEIPFIISFHDRVQIFHQLLRKEKQIYQTDSYHFGLPGSAIQISIRRNYIYEDAFEKLSADNETNLKQALKVSLISAVGAEEAGIDGGGLSKEFLGELLKTGFDPMRGFFKSTTDNLLYPNPSANVLFASLHEGYEIHYEFLGRILGKAIFEKIMVELPLAGFFLAKLLASKHSSDVDLHNLESLDPVLYKNLVYLKNYKGDVADLNLDFTISNNELGEHEVVELKPGGSKIPVTRENKIEYVHLVADYRLNKQIRAQCAAFKRGLAQLIDLDWLRMFDPRELQILISGAPTMIDISDWRRHTIYANGYTDDSEVIKNFWRVVESFDEGQKRKLLKFATSCSLPPLLGFKDLVPQFAIAPSEEARLPTASTCMNLLKLPECEDENAMRSKLLYAIESNSGFELS